MPAPALFIACLLAVPGSDLPAGPVPVTPPRQRAVLHDTADDGRLFALGANYKMCFGPEGARYVPVLGRRAPCSLPIDFRVAGAPDAVPVRAGDRVSFDRGTLVETYDLHLGAVEQSFLLRVPPEGAFLRIETTSELTYSGHDAEGLRFTAPGLGTVTYGDALAVDARGVTLQIPVEFDGHAIRVPLPEAWRDARRYPVVVDPWIKTIPVDDGADDCGSPDVAFAESVKRFQVSYLRFVSYVDADVLCATYDAKGNFIDAAALDLSLDDASELSVAYSSPHFMTAWAHASASEGPTQIRARARVAGGTGLSATIVLSKKFPTHLSLPSIGGGAGGTFLVSWSGWGPSLLPRILGRLATAAGPQGDVFDIDDSAYLERPVVSRSATPQGRWLVAYHKHPSQGSSNTTDDLRARQVNVFGNPVGAAIDIATFSDTWEEYPSIAVCGNDFLVAFERERLLTGASYEADIWIRALTGGASLGLGPIVNFSAVEPGCPLELRQVHPAIAFDGVRYTLTYTEVLPDTAGSELRAATFFYTPTFVIQEAHVLVASGPRSNSVSRVESAGPEVPGTAFLAWEAYDHASGDADVAGALWSTLGKGGLTVFDTGCGGPGAEPILLSSSVPALGATCGVVLLNFHAPLLALGPPSFLPICPGTGCQLGASTSTYVPMTSSVFTFTIGTNPTLLGTKFAVQGIDADPPASATSACGSATVPPFTVSDTLVFIVQ